jgi:hypothetical protein
MDFFLLKNSPRTKSMSKNDFFQSSEIKNELFKIQGRKTNFMQSLEMKIIIYPKKLL